MSGASASILALLDVPSLGDLPTAWAYATLALSAMLTQELGALLGGVATEQGLLAFPSVVATCAAAVFAESVALYGLGRWRAGWVRLKLRHAPPVVRKLLNAMRWSPWRSTIAARFAFGARIALPLACGAARVPPRIFITGTAIASLAWALAFVTLGWLFGEGAMLVARQVKRFEEWVGVALVLAVVGAIWWVRRRRGD